MRLLFLIPQWPSASELWLHRMIEAVQGDTVGIATYFAPTQSWRNEIPVYSLAPVVGRISQRLGAPSLLRGFGNRRLERVIRELDVSAVLCHYLPFALCFASTWERNTLPVFVHCHGYDVTWDLRVAGVPALRRFPTKYPRQVCELSTRAMLIANSQATRSKLEGVGVPSSRIRLKYLGVPVPDIPPTPRHDVDELQILFLGRLVDFKGPDLTIQAFDHACELGLRARLTLAGDGPLRSRCEQLKAASKFAKQIEILGAVDPQQAESLRQRADIFTAHNQTGPETNQEEALGVSVIEAMAAGLPVVTGRSGGVQETVLSGETGTLFTPGDVPEHAHALVELASPSLRHRMGSAGWRRAKDSFSLKQEAAVLRSILTECT